VDSSGTRKIAKFLTPELVQVNEPVAKRGRFVHIVDGGRCCIAVVSGGDGGVLDLVIGSTRERRIAVGYSTGLGEGTWHWPWRCKIRRTVTVSAARNP